MPASDQFAQPRRREWIVLVVINSQNTAYFPYLTKPKRFGNISPITNTRRALMTERDKALAAGNLAKFHALTRQIADLPMAGIKPLTEKDKARYAAKKSR
jgi:hypothetical protein